MAALLCVAFVLAGEILPKIAIAQIGELTNTRIVAKSVDFNLNGSVFIEGLTVRPTRQCEYDDAILKAQTVHARFSIGSLLLLRPRLKEISVDDFVFDAQQDLDTGRWNLADFKVSIPKSGSGKLPLISLNGGALQYSKVSEAQAKIAMSMPIDVEFGPAEKGVKGYSFTIVTAQMGAYAKNTLTGFWKPGTFTITGGISSKDIPAFEKVWKIDVMAAELNYEQSGDYSLKAIIKDFLYTYRVAPKRPALFMPKFLEEFSAVSTLQRFYDRYLPAGRIDIELEASGNLGKPAESTLKGKIYCKDVSMCDRKFMYPMKHITGQIDFTEKSLSLNNLSGEHNEVKLFFNGWARDFGENRKYQYEIISDNMALDDDLYKALNAGYKKSWSAFSPSGVVSIKQVFSGGPQTGKKRTLAVELLDIEAVYHRFPYPLKDLSGELFFDDDSTTISNLVSQFDGREITINGKVTGRKSERPIYDVSIEANNIPLDSTLADALTDGQKDLYNRFCRGGVADAQIKVLTPRDVGPTSFTANVTFQKTSLKIDKSEQVVSDASGEAVFTPDLIRIEKLRGQYAGGFVSLAGRIRPGRGSEEEPRYCLAVEAQQVLLSDDLFGLLPEPLEKIVLELQPAGKVNYRTSLSKADDQCPAGKVTVDCLGNSISLKHFAEPVKNITGRVTITKENIELEGIIVRGADNVEIMPNGATVQINGRIALQDNALADGRFELCAKDILLDERFGEALPANFRTYYARLSPSGRFDLDNIKIRYTKDSTDDEKQVEFAGQVRFKDCNLNTSPSITQLDAVLKIEGLYKSGEGLNNSKAALAAETLRIKGKSLTELKADIDYDRDNRSWTTKDLIADCYDGRLTGKFELQQQAEETLKYQLQIGFGNINLEKFLSDTKVKQASGNGYTQGQMGGSLSLAGELGSSYQRLGRCRLKVIDMQVGKLSPLANLLSVLKLTEPKDFAFEQMFVDSYIKQNELFIEKFDLSGDSVAFNGRGWMDLQNHNIALTLTARGRRLASAEPSILQSLTDTLGQAVVRMEVAGNYDDPEVTMTTLPVIKDTLGILGTEPLKRN